MLSKYAASLVVTSILAIALIGCGSTSYQLTPTNLSPSATGEVEVKTDDNANTKVDLEVDHMAPPQNLGQSLTTYVVWVDAPNSSETNKVGQLKINDKRKGELEFTTPHSTFELVVTAESTPDVRSPSNNIVLRQMVEAD